MYLSTFNRRLTAGLLPLPPEWRFEKTPLRPLVDYRGGCVAFIPQVEMQKLVASIRASEGSVPKLLADQFLDFPGVTFDSRGRVRLNQRGLNFLRHIFPAAEISEPWILTGFGSSFTVQTRSLSEWRRAAARRANRKESMELMNRRLTKAENAECDQAQNQNAVADPLARFCIASDHGWDGGARTGSEAGARAQVAADLENAFRDPSYLLRMSPAAFEALLCELFQRAGYEVMATPLSKDGGYDLVLETRAPWGRQRVLIEAKRYKVQNPVGVSTVRALYGVVELQAATAGVVVSTAPFTRGANDFVDAKAFRMNLMSFGDLINLIRHASEQGPSATMGTMPL